MAVRTSSAPQTQKYCPLLSSCVTAVSCSYRPSAAKAAFVSAHYGTTEVVPFPFSAAARVNFVPVVSTYETLVDIKYTRGKINIQTKSTKCQYKPQTSTSCAS